ncbi:cadherin repeat domain-containing protein, partial [Microvirga sp. 2MCAF35]|uniref:cadherin repeat domain-containing protein n=1 Tax=Microvirga sp. 2MCAF35 TaxID=3232987 RepID=UPI003F9E64A7
MASLTITAVKHNGGAQANTQPGSSQILMNENVASGTIVGKVTGFAGNPATMNLVVEPANLYANRYELWNGTFTDDDGVTQSGWFIRVKSGGTTLMDYEDQNFGYNPDFPELGGAIHSQITFKFYTGPVSSTNLTDQLVFDTILKDIVNEGPDNTPPHTIELDNGLTDTVVENLGVGQAVGTLTAQDDSTPAASISYSFATGFNGAGHFEIVGNQVKVKTALNYEDAVTTTPGAGLEQDAIGKFYRLKVIATDNATPALSSAEQEIKVYVTDFNEA